MTDKKKISKPHKTIRKAVEDVIYICILIPIILIAGSIVFQVLLYPHTIPNILGYKMFIIFNKYMDDSIEFGDLVITKNIDATSLKSGDIIAFRNKVDTVTIHRIESIDDESFSMYAKTNETNDTKFVKKDKLEGILKYRIPKIGAIIYYIQQPFAILTIGCFILIVGLIWIYIAQELDKKEQNKEQQKLEEQNKKKKQEENTKQLV